VVAVGWIGSLESIDRLPQDSTPAGTLMADEATGFGLLVATERASWHWISLPVSVADAVSLL
jgi:hypothetical protein